MPGQNQRWQTIGSRRSCDRISRPALAERPTNFSAICQIAILVVCGEHTDVATISQTGPIPVNNSTLDLSVLSTLMLNGHFTDSLGWTNNAGTGVLIFGSGITSAVSGTTLTDVTAGTFTQLATDRGGQTFPITGMSVSGLKFFDLIQTADWAGLAKLAFSGDDSLVVGFGPHDTLMGWNGADFLDGGADHDILNGGKGNDTLVANGGGDHLVGGSGADTFIFENLTAGGSSVSIGDFHHGVDILRVNSFDFTNIGGPGALEAAHFHLGTAATTAAQGLIYNQATGRLRADPESTGPQAQVLFAHLSPGTLLYASDFLLH